MGASGRGTLGSPDSNMQPTVIIFHVAMTEIWAVLDLLSFASPHGIELLGDNGD
jgi:hypothetical protein